ncbi:D-alanine aminotransferase [Baekduia alba]|uniref:aminotransferase class IV n=1 Tax=Baekduia alba TaxID=2997333 RepID=UPI0023427B41|nr:aminotransferase class IV [Baekduia alba]WCB97043.1 D-alanine aminotransferase [Baekduia alba]
MAHDALAILDGTVLPAADATIGVTDLGLIRGDGVFEVVSLHDGQMFALDDHLRRMATSAQNMRLEIDLNAVRADIETLAEAAGPVTGALRFIVTRGGRRIGLVEPERGEDPPLRLATVEYVPTRILDGVKSLSYGSNMLATRIAVERGGTEALLVTPHGRVLEAPTSAFFASLDGETLVTPPLSDHILDSITRRRLLSLLPHAREEVVTVEELGGAREAFLASTTREVQPAVAIDGRELPAAPGPLTAAAHEVFTAHMRDELGA